MASKGLPAPASSRMVTGLHRFTLQNFSLCKGVGLGLNIYSGCFYVGGHQWALSIFPDGTDSPITNGKGGVFLGLRVSLMSETDGGVSCLFKITLFDQTGEGHHTTLSLFDYDMSPPVFSKRGENFGFPGFLRRDMPENSRYLKNDCLKMECELSVLLPETEITSEYPSPSIRESNDDGINFLPLLESGEGFDVTFYVRGKEFRAHKVILSARSSVFNSMFASNLDSDQSEKIIVSGMEPRVFKALLHFIYTESLPEDEKCLVRGYAFGSSVSKTFAAQLLATADEYDLSRLKTICEASLWRCISFAGFVETLSLAKRYKASKLENLCLQYAARNYDALMDFGNNADLIKKHPLLLKGAELRGRGCLDPLQLL